MKQKIYIETSFISYLASKPSRNLIIAAHQQISQEWWENKKDDFELYTSELVIIEASKGDADIACNRLELLKEIQVLELIPEITELAEQFIKKGFLPLKAIEDAIHISFSIIYEIDYLLTWNCKHIANAEILKQLINYSNKFGYSIPLICTPLELLGE